MRVLQNSFKSLYTPKSLYQLFMLYALPLHIWVFLMAFRDFNWVAQRTALWDAIGLVSYSLVFAFIETTVFFLAMLVIGLLILPKWGMEKKTALLGTLGLFLLLFSILAQVYYLSSSLVPGGMINALARMQHPLRVLWGGTILLVVGIFVSLTLWILRSARAERTLLGAFERVNLLSAFYLVFDLVGLIIIIIRNLPA